MVSLWLRIRAILILSVALISTYAMSMIAAAFWDSTHFLAFNAMVSAGCFLALGFLFAFQPRR